MTTIEKQKDFHVVENPAGSLFYDNAFGGTPTHAFTLSKFEMTDQEKEVAWESFKAGKNVGYGAGRKSVQEEMKRSLGLVA